MSGQNSAIIPDGPYKENPTSFVLNVPVCFLVCIHMLYRRTDNVCRYGQLFWLSFKPVSELLLCWPMTAFENRKLKHIPGPACQVVNKEARSSYVCLSQRVNVRTWLSANQNPFTRSFHH